MHQIAPARHKPTEIARRTARHSALEAANRHHTRTIAGLWPLVLTAWTLAAIGLAETIDAQPLATTEPSTQEIASESFANGFLVRSSARPGPEDQHVFELAPGFLELNADLRAQRVSIRVEDVLREIVLESLRHPERGPALLHDWQRQVTDHATGHPVDARTYTQLREARQKTTGSLARRTASTAPNVSARELREARQLPGLGCVTKLQRQVVADLAEIEVESLVAVLSLYNRLYAWQTIPPPIFWLRDHNQDLIIDLAEQHFEATGDRQIFLAQMVALADVQRSLVVSSDGPDAIALLERVLDLDPDHLVARYWAGYLSEKKGGYRDASHHFGRYLETDPGDHEVRLRLAVNQLRTGSRREGEAALEALARDPMPPDWIRQVAWSERIRQLDDSDPRTVPLLREAIAAFPNDPALRLQLAYHLRLTDWPRSLEELEQALELGSHGAATPRVTYERAREEGLARNRAWLAKQLAARRPLLLDSLDTLERRWHSQRAGERVVVTHCLEILNEQEARR